jgi:hypothetical protein
MNSVHLRTQIYRGLVHFLVICRLKLGLFALVLLPVFAFASIDQPVRNLEQMNEPKEEQAVKLKNITVVIADYALIRKDFPHTASMTTDQIDQWLIDNVGYIAETQVPKNEVNTKIPLEYKSGKKILKKAYRPYLYNRALVLPVEDGFMDVKGTGSLDPQQVSHGNGLATTYEALREFVFEKKIQQIFSDAKVKNRTVGGYAALDFGFKIVHRNGEKSPAGAIVRQAHERFDVYHYRDYGNTFLEPNQAKKLELILRKYGVSSSGEGTWRTWGRTEMERDVINLQGNPKGEIMDFGPYRVRDHFDMDTYFYGDILDSKAKPLFTSESRSFVQPDPAIALSVENWGRLKTPEFGLKDEVLSRQIQRLVDDFKAGKASREDVKDFVVSKMGDGNYPTAKLYRSKVFMSCRNVWRF